MRVFVTVLKGSGDLISVNIIAGPLDVLEMLIALILY